MEPKRQFEPKPYKWEQRILTAVIILSTIFILGYTWIESHPQKPPAHESCYKYEAPKPLGPAHEGDYPQLVKFMDGPSDLHALSIDSINGEVDIKESAIFVGEGWDCILATAEKGCIIK